uniref:Uncharacterized protein n=1 Tax=Arundo donax TaxID=35708 RepID=A0A0A9AFZ1_ARUDO
MTMLVKQRSMAMVPPPSCKDASSSINMLDTDLQQWFNKQSQTGKARP